MAYLNKDKILSENNIYHAYNRGYRKQKVFHDKHDYDYFIFLLRKYLDSGFKIKKRIDQKSTLSYVPNQLCDEVELLAYCLMPNHFHLLLKLKDRLGMSKLVSRVSAAYSRHYNYKYHSEGSVWQGTYRASRIKGDNHLNTIITYIHQNPINIVSNPEEYKYSSLKLYQKRGKRGERLSWIYVVR